MKKQNNTLEQITYHQEEIRPFLVKYLTEAQKQIHLAIGWILDDGLLALLQKKAREGVEVILILVQDRDHKLNSASIQELTNTGVRIVSLDGNKKEYFIDHRFGIIDGALVLTGNYGWGYKKAPSETFLNVTNQLPSLAKGYEIEFEYLTVASQLSKNQAKPSNFVADLLKSLEDVKNLLSVGDTELIHFKLKEIEVFEADQHINSILEKLEEKSFEEALAAIKVFTLAHQKLRECIDPPIDSYRRKIQLLEEEIAAISIEFSESQKTIHKFSKMHSEILGDLLQQLLYQTKVKSEIEAKIDKEDKEKQNAFDEAEKDHEEYSKSYIESKKDKLKTLTKAEQKELKKLYRQNSLKCHPDRIVSELHDQAEEIFVELNQAYKSNDLEKIREISQQLKSGLMLSKSDGVTELKKLESTFKSLEQKLNTWQEKLNLLKEESSFKAVDSIINWDTYFKEKKEILIEQLNRLKEFNEFNQNQLKLIPIDQIPTD